MPTVTMIPGPEEMLVRYLGDRLTFRVGSPISKARAFLRTTLGRASIGRQITISEQRRRLARVQGQSFLPDELPAESVWRDVPMIKDEQGWQVTLALLEVGFFEAKTYLIDEAGTYHWPDGNNFRLSVHPNLARTGNTIYCAFVRMFGPTKTLTKTLDDPQLAQLKRLDDQGYTVIPPSGKLRDLQWELPHIFETLNCRILHLLPVNPTPTTYARFGRFGSPYACQDLTAIDPALVEFDRRTTGVEQFCELTHAVHCRQGRVFLDVVINHTGWGSKEMDQYPEWFLRSQDGHFVNPGAWGTVWEDLAEIDHASPLSWDYLAEVFLIWCRRGVDGFRCDAGYKVPVPCWKYVVARVRDEFPDTVFLLEGLGGAWEATQALMQEGGMQWAYSELFQNYSPTDVSTYLDHCLVQSNKSGVLVHYSETHDNDRLARQGREWSLLRNRLSGLSSVSGAFGFTCGVEWLAMEKVNVHSSRGLSWGNQQDILQELARLNQILAEHPCFFDGATTTRLSNASSPLYALLRTSPTNLDRVLVLINLDPLSAHTFSLPQQTYESFGGPRFDLLQTTIVDRAPEGDAQGLRWTLEPLEALCLATHPQFNEFGGHEYRTARARAAFAFQSLSEVMKPEHCGHLSWEDLALQVDTDPRLFLASLARLSGTEGNVHLRPTTQSGEYVNVVTWEECDRSRVLMIPPQHWLLVKLEQPFRARLAVKGQVGMKHRESVAVRGGHVVSFYADEMVSASVDATLIVECLLMPCRTLDGSIRFLSKEPNSKRESLVPTIRSDDPERWSMVLLTNGRGAMARFCVDLGSVKSKYDCLLGANLHDSLPVDRHVFVKRARVWVDAGGLISRLDERHLVSFCLEPIPTWHFRVATATGNFALISMHAQMVPLLNTTILCFKLESGVQEVMLKLIVRVDIEDRSFHNETHRNSVSETHFRDHCRSLRDSVGFEFTPAKDRQLKVFSSDGKFFLGEEWSQGIEHPIEQARGQVGTGDAFSPGWFELPLKVGGDIQLVMTSEPETLASPKAAVLESCNLMVDDGVSQTFERRLKRAIRAFIVQRNDQKTVVAGYPWFLDWGRDTLICARGLIAAGFIEDVRGLLVTFGRFEDCGTLPNTIHGTDASNRDTTDAPLWYGIVCEELAEVVGDSLYQLPVDAKGRTLLQVLESIAHHYVNGTPNGIHVDKDTGLVWSPSHCTWMDTNHPAGTPREGYPIEIQALWIRLLQQLYRRTGSNAWAALAEQATASFHQLYWLESEGYFADCLLAKSGCSARQATVNNDFRNNCLFAITLELVEGERAQQTVEAAIRWLVVPGALRSLAPKPVRQGAPIVGSNGQLLNDPFVPYWGQYQGDEDTRRKPAYHNGTAWTWTFPTFCEAVAKAWQFSPESTAAARAWLGSVDRLLEEGCIGHLPEVLDGNAPHLPGGCDAQAWSATEALRVWRILNENTPSRHQSAHDPSSHLIHLVEPDENLR